MTKKKLIILLIVVLFSAVAFGAAPDQRRSIYPLAQQLEREASALAQNSFDHFKGWTNAISDDEQAVLFKSEAFLASCRLFLRFTEDTSDYYHSSYLRTNLYNAFLYLRSSFQDLEDSMRRVGVMPYGAADCRRLLNDMDREFSRWPAVDNLAYLHQRYVKAADDTVYLIERQGATSFVRHPFKDLESLYRYNYDQRRGKDPWAHLVQVPSNVLQKIPEGNAINLTFEGRLVIEQGNHPNRSVYLIQGGRKRGLTSPQVLQRYGGWAKVFEVPAEVIARYPEGEPIN
jgi:hypothetical protein